MKRLIAMGVCMLCAVQADAAEPRLKWSFETRGKIYASPIFTDLDNDGKQEVIVCASRDKRILCLSCTGELLWDYRLDDLSNDGLQASPSALDIDGDGGKEIFFASKGGVVGCLDRLGQMVWRTMLPDSFDYSGPLVADIDGDYRAEIVVGGDNGMLYCFDDCGQERWHFQGDGPIRGIPAFLFDARAKKRLIFATFGGGAETAFDPAGKVVWSFNEPGPRKERRSTPAIGLIDADFDLDVVSVTEDFQVIVRDAITGAEKWRWEGKSSIDQANGIALADFDKRNRLDIVCADGTGQGGTGHVHRLRDGKALWSVDVGGGVVQGPAIGDVDGDQRLEILVCSRSKRLMCLDENGQEEWSFPSETEVITTPAIGDLDADGKTDIVFTSKDRRIYCLTLDGAYDASLMPWPMISHDPQLTGCFFGAPFTPPALPSPAQIPNVYLDEITGVHIGSNTVKGQITNNWYRPRRLEANIAVYTPNGLAITRSIVGRFGALDFQQFEFEFPALYPGEYRLVASLLDIGQGAVVSREEKKWDLDPQAPIDIAVERAIVGKSYMLERIPASPARTRLEAACAEAEQAWNARLEELRATIAREEATPDERRAALKALETTGEQLKHVFARGVALCYSPPTLTEFGAFPDTTLKKFFKDETAQTAYVIGTPAPKPAALSLCRNEREAVQILVVPLFRDLKNLRVTIPEDLKRKEGGVISTNDVSVARVGYVTIGPPEYNWHVPKTGEYPDVLFPNDPVDIPASQDVQPYYVTVFANQNTAAGDYEGIVRIEADECPPLDVPITVHVWDFAIPEKPNFKVSMWMNEGMLKAFYRYPDRTPFEVRKRFYQMHLDHRISPIKTFPPDGGNLLEDFEYLMANGQNVFFVDVPDYLPEADRAAAAEKIQATRALLQEKGWADKVLLYSMDEVAVMQRHRIPQMVEMNNWIKTVVPEWPRLETSAPEDALFGAVDIWCPTIDSFDEKILAERMAEGDRLWFYTVWGRPGIMIEFPPIDYRMMFWMCFKYKAEGFLYWGTTHWDLNCAGDQRWPEVPWIPYNRQPGHNGCGYLIYPGPDGTPLSSIRLEIVRDGIEDYEYLFLLQNLVENAKGKVPDELLQKAGPLVRFGPEIAESHTNYNENPTTLLEIRARIAAAIEELQRAVAGS